MQCMHVSLRYSETEPSSMYHRDATSHFCAAALGNKQELWSMRNLKRLQRQPPHGQPRGKHGRFADPVCTVLQQLCILPNRFDPQLPRAEMQIKQLSQCSVNWYTQE